MSGDDRPSGRGGIARKIGLPAGALNRAAPFDGAKAAVLVGGRLLVLRRDDRPGLRWRGMLDLPGGGREGRESPAETLVREIREETGLDLGRARWRGGRCYPAAHRARARVWFLRVRVPGGAAARIRMGAEGQGWVLMAPSAFVAAPDAVPHLRDRVAELGLSGRLAGDGAKKKPPGTSARAV
ncbi:NUDIX domain-containing protein [Wenxinia saemankumensis]|uniref:8-oxo-dGTP diphosphatase n=1 Tax=Wenxinia saemankumensis TaxID=1447782 RepID=A0A1M6FGA7_9RHOB|nr:NUDIX domain-containing protein [Wenxinia saemankumensis]SHI96705.1 8-oxo-dGTP diphosphatase [Wenxinia saemankumensis]